MPTYPLATLAPAVDATGISAPSYNDIYQSLIASFQAIYGSDIYVAPDSQDGQFLAILARAINDANQACVSVFNSFSPSFAQGSGLSALVKLNGLQRLVATNSQAVGNVVGTVGTTVVGGIVQDESGNLWDLPASVTIPGGGTISVTVTAQLPGATNAGIGAINKLFNPQLGWASFTNTSAATVGDPVETDAELRIRQARSVSLPSTTVVSAIAAAVANVAGVIRSTVYENSTGSADANGVPAHSIAVVVDGGSVLAVATAIASRKPPGIQTYGTTNQAVTDPAGITADINFYVLTEVPIYYAVTIKALAGYLSTTTDLIKSALSDFTNALAIGEDVYVSQAQAAASLISLGLGQTFYMVSFFQDTAATPTTGVNLVIAFTARATNDIANISVTVT